MCQFRCRLNITKLCFEHKPVIWIFGSKDARSGWYPSELTGSCVQGCPCMNSREVVQFWAVSWRWRVKQKHSVTNFGCSVLFRIYFRVYLRSSFVSVLVKLKAGYFCFSPLLGLFRSLSALRASLDIASCVHRNANTGLQNLQKNIARVIHSVLRENWRPILPFNWEQEVAKGCSVWSGLNCIKQYHVGRSLI